MVIEQLFLIAAAAAGVTFVRALTSRSWGSVCHGLIFDTSLASFRLRKAEQQRGVLGRELEAAKERSQKAEVKGIG